MRPAGALLTVLLLLSGPLAPAVGVAAAAALKGFSPAGGTVGKAVALNGSGFTEATAVSFNGVAAGFSVTSDTRIATAVPGGATSGPITVTTSSQVLTSAKVFKVTPHITGIAYTTAPAGTAETITGSAFTGTTAVTFNGVTAVFTVSSYSLVIATVPSGTGTGPIRVTTPGGSATGPTGFTTVPATTLTVDAGSVLAPISRGLFSNNHRYNDAGTGLLDLSTISSNPTVVPFRPDMLALAKQLGVTGLRFPGGTESDYYNWYDGIGPVLNRPICPNFAGPLSACNAYGIMEHMAFAEALGPDAVQWTGITLARHIRAADAANFVEFVNAPDDGSHPWAALRASYGHPQPYGVHYWATGNEVTADPLFFPDVNRWLDGFTLLGITIWDGAIAVRDAMKAIDPTIAVGTGWTPQGTDLYAALQARNTRFDFADIHGGLQGSGTTTSDQHYSGVDAATHIADRTIANQQLINSPQFPAVNGMEVVSWENDAATKALRYGLHHALTNAVSLTTLIADGIAFDSHSPYSSLSIFPPTSGARAEDVQWSADSPPDSTGNRYTSWFATAPSSSYDLFANNLGTRSVATTLTGNPAVTVRKVAVKELYATAALNDAGDVLGLIVTNVDPTNAWSVTTTLGSFIATSGTVRQVTGADVTTVNSAAAPATVQALAQPDVVVAADGTFTYTFPPHSITAIDFSVVPAPGSAG